MDCITFSLALEGYFLHARARRLSKHTISDYSNTFRKFLAFLEGDPLFIDITKHDIETFLSSQTHLSDKTLLNYHTGLSALWTWAVSNGYAIKNLLHEIERPNPEKRAIVPLSDNDVRSLLEAVSHGRPYSNHGAMTKNVLLNIERNRAIIFLLLDTGIRADELSSAKIKHLDYKNMYIKVFGKGSKERILPFSPRTGQVIWKYLATRRRKRPDDPLFATIDETPLDRHRLLKQLTAIGKRANVHANPHRFRHTFAINYLRNGGNAYTLQLMLGHSTLDMVKRYLNIAQADLQSAHRVASPVENMRL